MVTNRTEKKLVWDNPQVPFLNFSEIFSFATIFFEQKMEEEGYSNDWFLDDVNSSLNTILAMIKTDTQQLPQLELLGQIRQCLECLACSSPEEMASQRVRFVSLSWPADLRVVLQRIFRTFGIRKIFFLLYPFTLTSRPIYSQGMSSSQAIADLIMRTLTVLRL